MTTLPTKAGFALLALIPTLASHVTGQEPTTSRATIEFRVVATPWDRQTYNTGSSMVGPLAEGESAEMSMQLSLQPGSEGAPCTSSVTMSPAAGRPHGPFPFWHVEATLRRARMDDVVVAYAWRRRSQTGAGSAPTTEGTGEATLTEHGRVLLDYVAVQDASSGCFRNVALELAATIPEDPAFADRRIAYDLWLVHEDGGKRLTRRLQLIGKQGENVPFDHGLFRSPLHGVTRREASTAGPGVLEMTVSGTVRSRIQADGSIELLLVARRTARPTEGHWATEAHGEKRVQARPGETLQLDLPAPAHFEGANEPEVFRAMAEQRVSLVLTPTLVE